jgi:hypothetical protein
MAMELDLETFLTALYVIVDDVYQPHIRPQMPVCGGPSALMSDSEGLCLGLAAQWRSGVPWKSERGIMRYVRKHLRPLFPTLLTRSAFNRRLRRLWGAFILIQDAGAEALTGAADDDVMDGFPIPVAHGARSFPPGWLADIARIGKGGKVPPPTEWMAVLPSCGAVPHKPILSDSGFRGEDWLTHWSTAYAAHICPLSIVAPGAQRRWWSAARQVVETTVAHLSESFGLKYPGAHTGWGLLMRVTAKVAAYNLGIVLNRLWRVCRH